MNQNTSLTFVKALYKSIYFISLSILLASCGSGDSPTATETTTTVETAAPTLLKYSGGSATATAAETAAPILPTYSGDSNHDATAASRAPTSTTRISTIAGLENIRNNLSGRYVLAADIDLSSITNWRPIGNSSTNVFTGSLDGNGHTISGLNSSGYQYAGLFGYAINASISNIGVLIGTISSTTTATYSNSHAGGLVGRAFRSQISNSYVDVAGNISSTSSSKSYAGGLVGRATDDSQISNSYAEVAGNISSTSSTSYAGGLVGSVVSSQVNNSYGIVLGDVSSAASTSYAGGLVGDALSSSTTSNSYYSANRKSSQGVFTNTSGTSQTLVQLRALTASSTSWDTSNWNFGTTDEYPALKSTAGVLFPAQPCPRVGCTPDLTIDSAEDLKNIRYNLSGHYVLSADIDLSSVTNWRPIGDRTNEFTGSFDGNGHTISGLNSSGYTYAGLFGWTENANLSNIGVLVGNISSSRTAGGLVGYANNSQISNSYAVVTGDISSTTSSTSIVGGLVGGAAYSPISNSYAVVAGSISSTGSNSYAGGLVGNDFHSPISNSYVVVMGDISSIATSFPVTASSGISFVGGLVGYNFRSTIRKSYYSASRKSSQGAFTNTSGTPQTLVQLRALTASSTSWDASNWNFGTTDEYPALKSTAGVLLPAQPCPRVGCTPDPIISNADDLKNIRYNLSGHYVLSADIDLSSITNWRPIGNSQTRFRGSFDGKGFKISGLNSSGYQHAGLFGWAENASISNIGVLVGNISPSSTLSFSRAGGLVGVTVNTTISNAYTVVTGSISSSISSGNSFAGGLVGRASRSQISNSYAVVAGSISSTGSNSYAGGLVGTAPSGTISNSYAVVTGSISSSTSSGNAYAGGLAGRAYVGQISNSYAVVTGSISSSTSSGNAYAGGLAGTANSNGTISNSYYSASRKSSEGAFTSTSGTSQTLAQLRALTASSTSWETSNWNFGTTDEYPALKSTAGVLFPAQPCPRVGCIPDPIISNAEDLKNIRYNLSGHYVLSADIDLSSITNWQPIGDSSTNKFTGSFDGKGFKISGLNSSGYQYAGLFGYAINASISNLGVLVGTISATSTSFTSRAGGLVGTTINTTISNSYAVVTGSISSSAPSGNSFAGGLVGRAYTSPISNSYAVVAGDISSSTPSTSFASYAGGLVGVASTDSPISNAYAVVTGDISSTGRFAYAGGLAGITSSSNAISNSYYSASRKSSERAFTSTSGTSQTLAQLRALTASSTSWETSNWNFGTADEYPALKTTAGVLFPAQPCPRVGCIPDPIISNAEDLKNIHYNLSGHYVLSADIDLSSITNWQPIGDSSTNKFTGSFDGNGHTISGLNSSGYQYAGLFGYVEGASISNIGVLIGTISSTTTATYSNSHAGGLVGRAFRSQISNSYVDVAGNISSTSSSKSYAGGLVGRATDDSQISNSYAEVAGNISSTSSTSYAGGLVGSVVSSQVNNSYGIVLGDVSSTASTSYAGGLVGDALSSSTTSNSYYSANRESSQGAFTSTSGTSQTLAQLRALTASSTSWATYNWYFGTTSQYPALKTTAGVFLPAQPCPRTGCTPDPIISNADDLKNIRYNLSGHYVLSADIDLSSITNWQPIGSSQTRFRGSFDGKGFTISGLNSSGYQFAGLFGYAEDASISNLGVLVGTISTTSASFTSRAGGLVGTTINTTISNSYVVVTGSISSSAPSGNSYVGGLVGRAYTSPISNSYAVVVGDISSTASTSKSSYAGGLVGVASTDSPISNAYAIVTGDISSTGRFSSVGGLAGLASNSSTISNSYHSASRKSSEGAFTNTSGTSQTLVQLRALTATSTSWDASNWNFGTTDEYPALKSTAGVLFPAQPCPRVGCIPVAINSAEDLDNARNNLEGRYVLTADIDLSSIENWQPIGDSSTNKFTGNFDGKGFEISGLNSSGYQYAGLFGYVEGANISNIGILAGNISSASSGNSYVGGLVGWASGSQISNSYAKMTGDISSIASSESHTGGLVGYAGSSSISNSYAEVAGNISSIASSESYVGGLVGRVVGDSQISNSYAEVAGNISSTGSYSYAGGLVGYAFSSPINDSYADVTDDISSTASTSYAGGLVGYAFSSPINDSYADVTGDISPTSSNNYSYAGGLVGRASSSLISNSYAVVTGDIYSSPISLFSHVGGLVGRATNNSPINDSYAEVVGNITSSTSLAPSSSNSYAGGLVGSTSNGSPINNSYVVIEGNISSSSVDFSFVGGLVGRLAGDSPINNSYVDVMGSIFSSATSRSSSAGGLVGRVVGRVAEDSLVNDSYAVVTGDVTSSISSISTGVSHAGGLAGRVSKSQVNDSYGIILGTVSSTGPVSYAGGLVASVASVASQVNNSYYNARRNFSEGAFSNTFGTSQTLDELRTLTATATGWTAFYDASSAPAHALITDESVTFTTGDRRVWHFGDNAQLPILNSSPAVVSNTDLPLHRARQHFVAIAGSATQVDLSWSSAGDAYTYYEVYRHTTNDSSSATHVSQPLSVMGRTYVDTGLTVGTTYHYWLKACDLSNVCSDFFAHTRTKTKTKTTFAAMKGASPSSDTITLWWPVVSRAGSYQVYRHTVNTEATLATRTLLTGTVIDPTTDPRYDDTNLTGGPYFYWIKVCIGTGSAKICSDFSEAVEVALAEGTETNPYAVITVAQLQAIGAPDPSESLASRLASHYRLERNIDLSSIANWRPIGDSFVNVFTGSFDGKGFKISGLTSSGYPSDGLFGYVEDANLTNLGVQVDAISSFFSSHSYAGGLVGFARNSVISNSYAEVTGDISSSSDDSSSGGLVGRISGGQISNSYAKVMGDISSLASFTSYAGGLVGRAADDSQIRKSYAKVMGTISSVTSTPSADAISYAGGLVGQASGSPISNSYAEVTGNISSVSFAGSYPTSYAGGLVGQAVMSSPISNSFAVVVAGDISSVLVAFSRAFVSYAGGLVGGTSVSSISNSYYSASREASEGVFSNAHGTSSTVAELRALTATSTSWDVYNWNFGTTDEYPALQTAVGTIFSAQPCPRVGCIPDPIINNVEDLKNIRYNLSGHYVLAADIDLSGIPNWQPIGISSTNKFTGSFDGKGFTISGLTSSGYRFVGLFGYVEDANISNLGVLVGDISSTSTSSTSRAGGLIGSARNSTISNSYAVVTGNISSSSYSSSLGGLVGWAFRSQISNSYAKVTGNISSTSSFKSYAGGLVGRAVYASQISNSYADVAGDISSTASTSFTASVSYAGGLVGHASGSPISNSYAAVVGNVSSTASTSYAGGLVGQASGSSAIRNSFAVVVAGNISSTASTPSVSHTGGLVGEAGDATSRSIRNSYYSASHKSSEEEFSNVHGTLRTVVKLRALTATSLYWDIRKWNFGTTSQYPALKTTAGALLPAQPCPRAECIPVAINNAEDLKNIRDNLNGHYVLTRDIDLSSITSWQPIGDSPTNVFTGSFDGKGFTISGLNSSDYQFVGLFGYVEGANITNLGIQVGTMTSSFSSNSRVGGLVGFANNSAISNSYAKVTGGISSSAYSSSSGGLVGGASSSSISNSYVEVTGDISSGVLDSSSGGLVGYANETSISNSYADVTGNISSSAYSSSSGGLVGYASSSTISNSYAVVTGNVSSFLSDSISYAGGLVGYAVLNSSISNSYAVVTGNVSSTTFASSTPPDSYAGGLVGKVDDVASISISNSYYSANRESSEGAFSNAYGTPNTVAELLALTVTSLSWDTRNWNFGTTSQYPALKTTAGVLLPSQPCPRVGCAPDLTINSVEDLKNIRYNLSGHYVLAADIDLSDITNWRPIGDSSANKFTGSLDGKGFKISGLNSSGHQYAGLFGYVEDANISNLGVLAGNISSIATSTYSNSHAGGLVGRASRSQISNSYAKVTGNISSTSSFKSYVGGLVGRASRSQIRNSYAVVTGDISSIAATSSTTSVSYTGGLVGHASGSPISNSYAFVAGNVSSSSSTSYAGGLVGEAVMSSPISDSFAVVVAGKISSTGSTSYAGGLVGKVDDVRTSPISNSYYSASRILSEGAFSNAHGTPSTVTNLRALTATFTSWDTSNWDFGTADEYPALKSTAGALLPAQPCPRVGCVPDPIIDSVEDLKNIHYNLSGHYVLAADIDLSVITNWRPIGDSSTNKFTGSFDGNDHTISGLNSSGYQFAGLFGYVEDAKINDLGVLVRNISSIATVAYPDSHAGGLVGRASRSQISNSYAEVTGNISSTSSTSSGVSHAGGLVGRASDDSQIINSYAEVTGDISSTSSTSSTAVSYAGGLVGRVSSSQISDSYAVVAGAELESLMLYPSSGSFVIVGGDISSTSSFKSYAGGLVGGAVDDSQISNSYAGVAGNIFSTASASPTASVSYAGGLVGYASSSPISNSYASVAGKISRVPLIFPSPPPPPPDVLPPPELYIFGGDISSTSSFKSHAGGLVGEAVMSSPISNSYAVVTGRVLSTSSFKSHAGGLVGRVADSPISNSYAEVTGGIASVEMMGDISSSEEDEVTSGIYSVSSGISGTSHGGGLVGYASSSSIRNSHAEVADNISSTSSSNSHAGGLVGYASNGSISNVYAVVSGGIASSASSGTSHTGGLVGYAGSNSQISNSYAVVESNLSSSSSSSSSSKSYVGGLVGYAGSSPISYSYAEVTADISSTSHTPYAQSYSRSPRSFSSYAGGLVGYAYSSPISNSYVVVGGNLSSSSFPSSRYHDSHSHSFTSYAGGLVGYAGSSPINDSYAVVVRDISSTSTFSSLSSSVSYAGGLVGRATGDSHQISDSYYSAHRKSSEGVFNNISDASRTLVQLRALTATSASWHTRDWNFGTTSQYPALKTTVGTLLPDQPCPRVGCIPDTISSVEDLRNIHNNLIGYYVLTANIDLSGITDWQPIGDSTYKFTGSFDGNGHTISGLNSSGYQYAGLFGYVENANISNLGVLAGNISSTYSGNSYVGGLVGWASGSQISNSYAVVVGDISSTGSISYVGGLVGYAYSSPIRNSYATISGNISSTTTSGPSYSGGLVGYAYSNSQISNSYAVVVGNISSSSSSPSSSFAGGLVGRASSRPTNSYYSASRKSSEGAFSNIFGTSSTIADLHALTAISTDWGAENWNFGTISQYPALKTTAGALFPAQPCPRVGCIPDIVDSVEDLKNIRDNLNGHYALTADIDLPSTMNWRPIGDSTRKFTGSFDGRGHTISGLNSSGYQYAGLFGYVENANISNLGVLAVNISASATGISYAGGLVGTAVDSTISNSYAVVTGDISSTGSTSYAGGLVGRAFISPINNSYAEVTGNISSDGRSSAYVGGLTGYAHTSPISHSYSVVAGDISSIASNSGVGGLVGGARYSPLSHSYAVVTGDISYSSSNTSRVGGLVGTSSTSSISHSYAVVTGDISSTTDSTTSYVGGLVGSAHVSPISNSYTVVTGDISSTVDSTTSYVGGLVGWVQANPISNSYAVITGDISSTSSRFSHIGGLTGYAHTSPIRNSYTVITGDISSTGSISYVGGLVGSVYSSQVNNSYYSASRKSSEGAFSNNFGVFKTVADLKNPTGLSGIYASWTAFYDASSTPAHALITDTSVTFAIGDRRVWHFGDSAQLPSLNPSPADIADADLSLYRARQHFVATASSATQINLSWSSAGNAYTYYEVYRHTTNDNSRATHIGQPLSVMGRTYMDTTGLTTGTTYHYWFKACPANNECSDFLAHTQATTP